MTFIPQNLVYVYYHAFFDRQLMGHLFLKNRQIFFEYDTGFVKLGLELSPFKLPLKSGVIASCESQFRNAVFNVLSHNRDDHSKNFSFLMKAQ